MRIVGPASGDYTDIFVRLVGMGAAPLFIEQMAPALWKAAVRYRIDPVGVLAQSYKETGGGRFGGRVTPQHYNTCGLKVRHLGYGGPATTGDEQLAHAAFASWEIGATAHVQHLRAYTGWPIDDGSLIVDPRYWLVVGKRFENFEDLGGSWAPSLTYGTELVGIARRLQGAV